MPLCLVLKPIHSVKWPSTGQHDSTLPSAETLALGKVSNVCRVSGSSTRQSGHVAPPWASTLPSARRRHSAVSAVRHSAKCRPRVAPRGCFAECPKSDTRQRSLHRGRLCRVAFAECNTRQRVCRVQTGLSLLSHSRWHITEPGPSFCPSVSRWNKNKIFCLQNQGLRRELIWSNKEHQKITRFCNELNQFLLLDKQSKLKQKSTFCFASIMLEPN